jgi:glycosyltransferase involved in cell wall biosynthesis
MMSFLGTLYQYRTMPTMLALLSKLMLPKAPFLVQFANIGKGGGLKSSLAMFLFQKLKRLRYGSLLVMPDIIVALSEDHRQRMLALAPSLARRIHIVPCCPQMPIAADRASARLAGRRRFGIADDEILVMFFGRLYPGKGIEELIEAVASLLPRHPQLRVSLIGGFLEPEFFFNASESYENELKNCIDRLGMTDKVHFSGEYNWDGPEASEYLHAADIAVLPLGPGIHLYNSSLAAVCAHGVPVIGTQGQVVDPALQHGKNVFFIKDAEPQTISAAIEVVLNEPDLRTRLREGSLQLADDFFNWSKVASKLSELMKLT